MRQPGLGAAAASILIVLAPAPATADRGPAEIGRWPDGAATAAARSGDLVWLGSGSTLQAWRFTPPGSVEAVGEVALAGPVREITVEGDLVFVAVGHQGLQIIDVGDPTYPVLVGAIRSRGFANGIAVRDGVAWVAATRAGLRGYDVTDPRHPRLIGVLVPAEVTYDVSVGGGLLWVASIDGLHAVDITDPRQPEVLSTTSAASPWGLRRVAVEDGFLFAAASWAGMEIYDASDPYRPGLVGSIFQWECPTVDVAVAGHTAALLCESFLSIADVSDPTDPVELATVETVGGCALPEPLAVASRKLAADGDTLVVADGCNGLRVLNVSDPRLPEIVATREVPGHPSALSVIDHHILVASDCDLEGSLRSLDVSSPEAPSLAGGPVGPGLDPMAGRDMVIAADHVYLAGDRGGLHIYDLVDPANPSYVREHQLGSTGGIRALAGSGSLLVAALSVGEIVIHDLASPTDPLEIGRLDLETSLEDVVCSGSLAYAVGGLAGLVVVDLGAPAEPSVISTLPAASARRVAADGGLVLVGTFNGGLIVFDASNPSAPAQVGRLEAAAVEEVAVHGSVAVISTYQDEACGDSVRFVDLADPTRPVDRGGLCALDPQVAFVGDIIAVADRFGGLRLIDPAAWFEANPAPGEAPVRRDD